MERASVVVFGQTATEIRRGTRGAAIGDADAAKEVDVARAHLVEAKRLLDEATAQVDDETRGRMLTNLRVNRDIMAAAKAAGL